MLLTFVDYMFSIIVRSISSTKSSSFSEFEYLNVFLFCLFVCLFQLLCWTAAPYLHLGWVSEWYLNHILLLLLQHRSGVKPHYVIASFCSSASALLGIILQHLQPARRGDSTASPPPKSDSHDSGRPSATAQIRDQHAARWLDLTVQRAGGLSTEVKL